MLTTLVSAIPQNCSAGDGKKKQEAASAHHGASSARIISDCGKQQGKSYNQQ